MLVQTNTGGSLQGGATLAAQVETVVVSALTRVADQISRVEVYLSDENGAKGGANDKRCTMEARIEGRPPLAVTHQATTVEQAMSGAAAKLAKSIEATFARLRAH